MGVAGEPEGARMKAHDPLEKHDTSQKSARENRIKETSLKKLNLERKEECLLKWLFQFKMALYFIKSGV